MPNLINACFTLLDLLISTNKKTIFCFEVQIFLRYDTRTGKEFQSLPFTVL